MRSNSKKSIQLDSKESGLETVQGRSGVGVGQLVEIPLSALVISDHNVRKVARSATSVAELAALIESQGLINPLSVIAEVAGKNNKPTGRYGVIAGGGRFAALSLLAEQGKLPPDEPITCILRTESEALAVSIAENSGREELHPADEFVAFKKMLDAGKSIDDVAAKFGVSALVVKQRLQLANVAPEFIELYREGKCGLDVLRALALTTDHKAQRRVWKEVGSSRNAHVIRRALTQGEVAGDHPQARFVGVKAYEKAGGEVRRDLFQQDQQGYFTDRALLERLVREKLQKAADAATADGAAWVEIIPACDFSIRSQYVQVKPVRKTPTAKQQAKLDALAGEAEQLETRMNEPDTSEEDYERLDSELAAIEAKRDAIESTLMVDDPNQIELAGAVVSIDGQGKLSVDKGLLRKADAAKLQATAKAPATGADVAEPLPAISDSMARRLSVHRTLALQVEMMRRPDIAVIALTAEIAGKVFSSHRWNDDGSWYATSVGVTFQLASMPSELDSEDVQAAAARIEINAAYAQWKAEIQQNAPEGALLPWLLTLPTDRVLCLLAFCTALRTDATVTSARYVNTETATLAQALKLNMRNWWTATAENYFNGLTKPTIIADIEDITGKPAEPDVHKMKKSALALHAEQLVAEGGCQWLPAPMREGTPN